MVRANDKVSVTRSRYRVVQWTTGNVGATRARGRPRTLYASRIQCPAALRDSRVRSERRLNTHGAAAGGSAAGLKGSVTND